MDNSGIPSKFSIPWGYSAGGAYIRVIPTTSQIGIQNGAASLTDGFPPVNSLPVGSGGVPPFMQDHNGILKQITQWLQWTEAGAAIPYDSTFQTAIGGYPKGAIVASASVSGALWMSTADNNVTNPDTGGAGWAAYPLSGHQVFTTGGTFTVPFGVTRVEVECWAGGGGSAGNAVGQGSNGGGGGGYAWKLITGLTPGATVAVTVGAGGTLGGSGGGSGGDGGQTKFGTYVTCNGGGGASFTQPGAGGAASGGDVNYNGTSGGAATPTPSGGVGGEGGGAFNSPGGPSGGRGADANAATMPGAGAGGTGDLTGSTVFDGGAGAAGRVIVKW